MSRVRRCGLVMLACVGAFATPALAQPDSAVGIPGLGALTFPTSATVPAAGQAFLRGVLLLHAFEYDDAAAAFREAERLEPGFALAYWGEAMTFTHPVWDEQDVAAGRAALAKLGATPAARAAKTPTARERGYLAAVEILYGDGPKARRDTLYSAAMARVLAANPRDDEARLFYALSLLGLSQGVRDVPTWLRAAVIAESVLARNPRHPGAAHYVIHGRDDPEHAAGGMAAAKALAGVAPGAGHAQHMTSHIFVARGMWDEDVTANDNALRVVNAWLHDHGRPPAFCGHYNLFLDYGLLQLGRLREAARLLASCRGQSSRERPGPHDLDPDDYSFVTMWSRYVLDARDWSGEVARWSVDPGPAPAPRLSYWFTRGFAAARRGDTADARQALTAYRQAQDEVRDLVDSGGAPPSPDEREFLKRIEVLRLELAGLVARLQGDGAGGLDTLRRATVVEDSIAYVFGPPFVNQPSHELLGEELLATGRAPDALAEFRNALSRTPGRTAVLVGIARAARASGDTASAAQALARLAAIWHGADPDYPGLAELRPAPRAPRPDSPPGPPPGAAPELTDQASGTTQLLIGLAVVDERVVWVSGTGGTFLRTTDGGATWHAGHVPGADTLQFRDVYAVDSSTAWLLSIGNGTLSRIYRTLDGGRTWALQFTNDQPKAFYDCLDFWDPRRGLAISDAVDGRTVVLATDDGGDHWTRVPPERLPPAVAGEGSFAASGTCVVTRAGGEAWIAVGTPTSLLLHTRDYGATWTADTVPISGVTSVSFRDRADGIVAGFDSTVAAAATHDGGRTWARGGPPPFRAGVYGAAYVPGAPRPTVVAVGPGGSAYSQDDGATWTPIDGNAYWSVAFASPRAGWMVGPHGRITKLGGF